MKPNGTRYVLALGDDARVVERTDGTAIIERSPGVVLVETDATLAEILVHGGDYVHVFSSPEDAHRAFAVFLPTP